MLRRRHAVSIAQSIIISHWLLQSSSHYLLQRLHIKQRIHFRIANITFRTLHSSQPVYLLSTLQARHSTRSLRLSNTNLHSMSALRLEPIVPLLQLLQSGISPSSPSNVYQPWQLPPSPQDPLSPAGLPTQLARSSCASDSADHCARLLITFTYLLTLRRKKTERTSHCKKSVCLKMSVISNWLAKVNLKTVIKSAVHVCAEYKVNISITTYTATR